MTAGGDWQTVSDDKPPPPVQQKNSAGNEGKTAKVPTDPNVFASDKGKKWNLNIVSGTKFQGGDKYPGAIYSSSMPTMGCDKARTSIIDGKPFWNFGDCLGSTDDWIGFDMGSAYYASTTNPLQYDTHGKTQINKDLTFAKPWYGDADPPDGQYYGMDTSNTAQVAPGEGIAFAWEVFRTTKKETGEKGQAVLHVTLGEDMPVAQREEGLRWGPNRLYVGEMTVFNPNNLSPVPPNAGGYLYMYSVSTSVYAPVIVGRVKVGNAFDHNKYEFQKTDGTWDDAGQIPASDGAGYGMSGNPGGPISNAQGSIMYNYYLGKYMLWTSKMATTGGFYLSDSPVGPWGDYYEILGQQEADQGNTPDKVHYGVNCHPALLPNSDGKEVLVSWGTNSIVNMFKLSFEY